MSVVGCGLPIEVPVLRMVATSPREIVLSFAKNRTALFAVDL
jgi:hypothetical protein